MHAVPDASSALAAQQAADVAAIGRVAVQLCLGSFLPLAATNTAGWDAQVCLVDHLHKAGILMLLLKYQIDAV